MALNEVMKLAIVATLVLAVVVSLFALRIFL